MRTPFLPVGKISRTYGTQGQLALNLYDTFPSEFNTKEPLYLFIDGLTVPLFIESFHRKGKNGAVIIFSDIDTERRAEELLGLEINIKIPADHFAAIDHVTADLEGFKALFVNTGASGTIVEIIENELNPLFRVLYRSEEVYIPIAEEYITAVDIRKREITFDLPAGLIDLNSTAAE